MAGQNDLGSKSQRIRNPMLVLGLIQAAAGLYTLYLGLGMLTDISSLVKSGQNPAAWISLFFGVVIALNGLVFSGAGLLKCLSLTVGRHDPKSLATDMENPGENQLHITYKAADLAEMLNSRMNKTFVEPRCWVESLCYTLFRSMFFLPPPYRNILQGCVSAIINTLVLLCGYGALVFLVDTSLVGQGSPVLAVNLCALFFGARMVFLWRRAFVADRNRVAAPDNLRIRYFTLNIAYALAVPAFLGGLFTLVSVPADGVFRECVDVFNAFPWISWFWAFALIPLLITLPILFLTWCKTLEYDLKTEVTERIEDWQESVHPDELFSAIDNKAMAGRRFRETPNRVYSRSVPGLQSHSSESKGEFFGYTVQETQPECIPSGQHPAFVCVKFLLGLAAGIVTVLTYSKLAAFAQGFTHNWNGAFDSISGQSLAGTALTLVLLLISAKMLWDAAGLFYSELKFSSLMIYYKNNGTYTTSTVTVGSSVYDSHRSENTVVRSSFHQWLIISRIISATFVGRGFARLDGARFVMEMHGDPATANAFLGDLRSFLDSFSVIADVAGSGADSRKASGITRMNADAQACAKIARDNAEVAVTPAAVVPPIDSEISYVPQGSGETADGQDILADAGAPVIRD